MDTEPSSQSHHHHKSSQLECLLSDHLELTFVLLRYRGITELSKDHRNQLTKKRDLKYRKLGDDEYLRQYLQFYYQFQKSEGFAVEWDQFDYAFHTRSLDNPPRGFCTARSPAELVREVTLLTIEKQNEAKVSLWILLSFFVASGDE
ncbi:hypothetical protein YC2023_035342 [Brassica napus]